MKNKVVKTRCKQGFTLIELLVVVLIIGILAAVALPQYNKAVMKTQGAEVLDAVNALDKGVAAYYLEHGTYEGISNDTLPVQLPELEYFSYVDENPASSSAHKTHAFVSGKVGGYAGSHGIESLGAVFDLYIQADREYCLLYLRWEKGKANRKQASGDKCKKYFNLNCNKNSYEVYPEDLLEYAKIVIWTNFNGCKFQLLMY